MALLVLDTNILLFALSEPRIPACSDLLELLIGRIPRDTIRLPRTIVQEIVRNLTPEAAGEFFHTLNLLGSMDEDFVVPFELGAKYERQGFKPADGFIAAYTEWVGADFLVSQNRHFLSRHKSLPFRVLNAEACLKQLKHLR